MRPDELEDAVAVRALLFAPLVSRALCGIAELGIPDLLAAGPRSVAELAGLTGAHEPSLRQALTALVAFEVFEAHGDDRFALARLGSALTTEAPGTALPTALLAHAVTGRAWHGVPDTLRTGRPAFDTEFGTDFFAHLEARPWLREIFDRSQAADLDLEIAAILRSCDLSAARLLVDVGGGDGALLARLLDAHPRLRGVLVDRPAAVTAARERLGKAGLAGRAEATEGDFFTAVPGGGDVYLMREILHDWDDAQCVTVLRACRRAMPADGRLLVIELAADDGPDTGPRARMTALMSLYMLSVLPGRERTARGFGGLLAAAGFHLTSVHRLTGHKVLIEASPGAAPTRSSAIGRRSERSTDHV
ncbi:methyltransferase [Streptomyces sp. NBC_01803]|uniref:methyltransferase n=1 Tax=Streptomyces sp. NBC_01803 TaxID=2975946 RepID=UPI002DDB58BF|nr:methyltransferase [Streptomyces sp. NBC_01803]WSA47482.1 methyltransferase [Streptomyces sp. NBC_01803]